MYYDRFVTVNRQFHSRFIFDRVFFAKKTIDRRIDTHALDYRDEEERNKRRRKRKQEANNKKERINCSI